MLPTVIAILVLSLFIGLAVYSIVRDKKNGKCCGGSCSSCGGACASCRSAATCGGKTVGEPSPETGEGDS